MKFVDEGSEKQLVFSDDPVRFKPLKDLASVHISALAIHYINP